MIGSIIGGGLKAAGAVAGMFAGMKAAREQKKIVNQQLKDNQMWYDRRYNEDSTERADAVAALEKQKEAMRARTKNFAGRSAVMGGTNEQAAIEKGAQTNALGNTVSDIAVAGEARKDNIENSYMNTKSELNNQLANIAAAKGQAIAGATAQMGSIGDSLSQGLIKK